MHAIEESVFTLGKCCIVGGEIVSLDCCGGECKCCITMRYRIWLIAHFGGLGFFEVLEWEITDGVETLSGIDRRDPSWSGKYFKAGNFVFHTTTARSPFICLKEPDPGWMSSDPADIDTQCQAEEITLTLSNSTFCGDTGRRAVFYGEDSWTESIPVDWGTGSDLPSVYGADSDVRYKYGTSEWHEIQLCTKDS